MARTEPPLDAARELPSAPTLEDFRAWVERSPGMLWRSGSDGGRSYFNAAWLAFTGRAFACEAGWGWLEAVHRDDVETCRRRYLEHVEQERPFELVYRLRRADGAYRAVVDRGAPYAGAGGELAGFAGSCVDADALDPTFPSGSRDFFEMSLDHLSVAGFDGYLKRVNPSWTRTLGWTADELKSRPSVEFVHPDDRAATLAGRKRLTSGDALGHLVNRYLCKDGSFRWFEWRSVADPERGLVYAAARDVTEQKNTEEQLAKATERQELLQRQLIFAERMASMGTLAAGVAHEINNPLAFVAANAAMLVEELDGAGCEQLRDNAEDLRQMARDIQTGAERIRKIVRALKTFSRAEEQKLSVLEVGPVLELAINMTQGEVRHRARLTRDYQPLPSVLADEARLGQVFVNLIVNAAQAIAQAQADISEIRIATRVDGAGRAVIEVHDNGEGIPAHLIDRVFDPFFTTKPVGAGTGLGLSICHNIVAGMGGQIVVESAEGRGTCVRVVLSPAPASAPSIAAPAPRSRLATARARVLVVDDEPSVGMALRRVLGDHEVTVLTSAREGFALLVAGEHFDLLLSDLMMPDMSGMDLYDQVNAHFPELAPFMVFLSGGAFTEAGAAFLERIPNPHIEKPFDATEVRNLVGRLLHERSK